MEGVLMLKLSELKRMALKEGVPQALVEKDYALSAALKAIAASELARHVVFKGGTAVRKAYFKEARFSEDLDFTVLGLERGECLELLKETLERKQIGDASFEKVEEERTPAGLKAAVKYEGPLAHAQRIRFDFNFRENIAEKPERRELFDIYGIGQAEMDVLSLEEIFAEKLHALGSRSAPRDLYDTWFLFSKGMEPHKEIVERKFAYYNQKFDAKNAIENARKSRENWEWDLRQLVRKLPDFETLEREVEKRLEQIS